LTDKEQNLTKQKQPTEKINIKLVLLKHFQKKKKNKIEGSAGHWWLTPIILATQEAKISRIKVRSQPKQIVCETLS
jgi:hypothetical protein